MIAERFRELVWDSLSRWADNRERMYAVKNCAAGNDITGDVKIDEKSQSGRRKIIGNSKRYAKTQITGKAAKFKTHSGSEVAGGAGCRSPHGK